jgi:ATP-binding cassette subfamily C (CFTR/MRP) protein 1
MHKLMGTIKVNGSIAYVSQQAWIQNATVKDNILFGKPYIEELYKNVMFACALETDFKLLIAGDQTEIGEKVILFFF